MSPSPLTIVIAIICVILACLVAARMARHRISAASRPLGAGVFGGHAGGPDSKREGPDKIHPPQFLGRTSTDWNIELAMCGFKPYWWYPGDKAGQDLPPVAPPGVKVAPYKAGG